MRGKKKPASNRNRHIGRINAYKADVIKKGGKPFRCSQGNVYSAAQVGTTPPVGFSIVRRFGVV